MKILGPALVFGLASVYLVQASSGAGDITHQRASWQTSSVLTELFRDASCENHGSRTKFYDESVSLPERQKSSYPWIFQPICSEEISNGSETLCILTSHRYNEGRGISIITTLEIATSLIRDSILFPNVSTVPHSALQRATQDSSMTGKGLVSKVSVWSGEQILSDKPVLLIHPAFMTDISWLEKEELLRIAVSQLPKETQKAVLNLSTNPTQFKFFLSDLICGHAGFQAVIGDKKHFLVYTKGSLVNHSCAPNSFFRVDQYTLTLNMVAARKINVDEEVTMSYSVNISPDVHFEQFGQRQKLLEKTFSFRCQCKRCRLGPRTDQVLLELLHHQQHLETHPNLKDAHGLIELYRKIGMDVVLDIPYNFVSKAYKAIGRTVEAELWAERSTKIRKLSDARGPSILNGD